MRYRWVMLLLAAAAMVGTLPGRTQGLGLVTEPLITDLHIGRVEYAQINLWATLIGSVFAVGIGRFIDRFGTRVVLTAVVVALGVVVCAMSAVQSFWTLAIFVTLTRGLGQSALSVISLTMVGRWFTSGIDSAMAIYSVVMSIGFMIAFPVVGSLVQSAGWRSAWLAIGVVLLVVLAPLSFLGKEPAQRPDAADPVHRGADMHWLDALKTSG
ncbi:MAG TPA: MFS transporter, partial [Vicinamibacterales bacterium]|nr:MFS transporter [Vicinamibacterales bacterium]